jgi:hypothetical protein
VNALGTEGRQFTKKFLFLIILSSPINIDEILNKTFFFMDHKYLDHEISQFFFSHIKNISIKPHKEARRSPIWRRPKPRKISIAANRIQPRILKFFLLVSWRPIKSIFFFPYDILQEFDFYIITQTLTIPN